MSFSNDAETDVLNYAFRGVVPSWGAQANYWFAAHTADPGEAGTAVTSEAAYGSYARVLVVRSSGLSVSGNTVSNVALVQFPQSTVAGSAITHISIVDTASGAGKIIGRMTLASSIPTSIGIQPQAIAGALTFTLD